MGVSREELGQVPGEIEIAWRCSPGVSIRMSLLYAEVLLQGLRERANCVNRFETDAQNGCIGAELLAGSDAAVVGNDVSGAPRGNAELHGELHQHAGFAHAGRAGHGCDDAPRPSAGAACRFERPGRQPRPTRRTASQCPPANFGALGGAWLGAPAPPDSAAESRPNRRPLHSPSRSCSMSSSAGLAAVEALCPPRTADLETTVDILASCRRISAISPASACEAGGGGLRLGRLVGGQGPARRITARRRRPLQGIRN